MKDDCERQERARAKAAVDAQSAQVQAWIKANDLQRYVTRAQSDCATRWRAHLSPWPKRSRVHYSDLEVVVEAEVGRYPNFRFGGVVAVLVSGGDNRGRLVRIVRWTKPTEQKVVEALRARLWNLAEREVRDAEYRARCVAAERVQGLDRLEGTMKAADIAAAIAAVQKKRKRDACIGTGTAMLVPRTRWLSTGSWALDRIIRGRSPGGIPLGCIAHVPGAWSTGKSPLLDHLILSAQRAGGVGYISETEGSRDAYYADRIGLDLGQVTIDRPVTLEEACENFLLWHAVFRRRNPEVPVLYGVDSLDSTKTERTMGDLTESHGWMYGGNRSQLLGVVLGKLAQIVARWPTTVVLLNQVRDKVGVMFGPKTTTPGGNPPHFYASIEVELTGAPRPGYGYVYADYEGQQFSEVERKRLGLYKQQRGALVGRWVRARISKTKISGTYDRVCDYFLDFHRGILRSAGFVECLQVEGLMVRSETGVIEQRRWVLNGDGVPVLTPVERFRSLQTWATWLQQPDHFTLCLGAPQRWSAPGPIPAVKAPERKPAPVDEGFDDE